MDITKSICAKFRSLALVLHTERENFLNALIPPPFPAIFTGCSHEHLPPPDASSTVVPGTRRQDHQCPDRHVYPGSISMGGLQI